ncbi:hypothetical protein D3C71_1906790 [compost metagenome]
MIAQKVDGSLALVRRQLVEVDVIRIDEGVTLLAGLDLPSRNLLVAEPSGIAQAHLD